MKYRHFFMGRKITVFGGFLPHFWGFFQKPEGGRQNQKKSKKRQKKVEKRQKKVKNCSDGGVKNLRDYGRFVNRTKKQRFWGLFSSFWGLFCVFEVFFWFLRNPPIFDKNPSKMVKNRVRTFKPEIWFGTSKRRFWGCLSAYHHGRSFWTFRSFKKKIYFTVIFGTKTMWW